MMDKENKMTDQKIVQIDSLAVVGPKSTYENHAIKNLFASSEGVWVELNDKYKAELSEAIKQKENAEDRFRKFKAAVTAQIVGRGCSCRRGLDGSPRGACTTCLIREVLKRF